MCGICAGRGVLLMFVMCALGLMSSILLRYDDMS